MKRIILNTLYFLLFSLFLFGCEIPKDKHEYILKIVSDKTINSNEYIIAFTDETQVTFDLSGYNIIEKGDTIVFNCIKDSHFCNWNCGFYEIRK